MPRARLGSARHRKKKRILKAAKGYRGSRGLYRQAKEAITRAGVYAYRDRRTRKRSFRRLWITRVSAACRSRGVTYEQFISRLKKASVTLNRKMLSEIAIADPEAFEKIMEEAGGGEATGEAA
jgi:large subunit ribosomal protein L20